MIAIKKVETKKQLAAFVDFPHKLYEGDKNYVPELHIAQRDVLTPGKHPFHNHSSMQLFLAFDGDVIKGRIAAILNNNHNKLKNATDGFFGFYDLYNDQEVSKKLLAEAKKWLIEKGATKNVKNYKNIIITNSEKQLKHYCRILISLSFPVLK